MFSCFCGVLSKGVVNPAELHGRWSVTMVRLFPPGSWIPCWCQQLVLVSMARLVENDAAWSCQDCGGRLVRVVKNALGKWSFMFGWCLVGVYFMHFYASLLVSRNGCSVLTDHYESLMTVVWDCYIVSYCWSRSRCWIHQYFNSLVKPQPWQ